jgi:hypothetical protein
MGNKKKDKKKFSSFSEILGVLDEKINMKESKKNRSSKAGSSPLLSTTNFDKANDDNKKNNKNDHITDGLIAEVENIPDLELRFNMMLQESKIKNLRERILDSEKADETIELKDLLDKETFRYQLMTQKMNKISNDIKERWELQEAEIEKDRMIRAREDLRNLREKYGDDIMDKIIA